MHRSFIPKTFIGAYAFQTPVEFAGSVDITSYAVIHRTRYLNNENQFVQNTAQTKYVLSAGKYILDTQNGLPFVISKPFELPSAGGVEIVGDSTILYLGSGTMFENTNITGQLILQLTSIVLLGAPSSPSRTLFNLVGTGASRPVLLIDFVQPILWASLGTLTGFDTIVIGNFSIRFCAAGLTMTDTVNLISGGPMNLQDTIIPSGTNFLSISGTTSPSIQFTQINFIPNFTTDYAIHVANTVTPNMAVSNSVYDYRNTSIDSPQFYDPSGLTKSSIYVISKGIKNVLDSVVQSVMFGTGTDGVSTLSTQFQYFRLVMPSTRGVENEERISGNTTTFQQKYIGLEVADMIAYAAVNLSVTSGTHPIELQYVHWFNNTLASCTADNATDTFTATAHGLVLNDLVQFSGTTAPTGISFGPVYRVINPTANTFQVEKYVGAGLTTFTTNGTGLFFRTGQFEGISSSQEIKSTLYSQHTNSTLLTAVYNNDDIQLMVANSGPSSTVTVLCNRYSSRIRS